MFIESQIRLARLSGRALLPPRDGIARRGPRRFLTMLLFIPGLWLLNLYHWLGLALDEILFRGYRRVEIRKPVFVLGAPRSGTTFMHGVLAEDEQHTTFATWECYFGLSVTWRRFWRLWGRIDRMFGRPAGRLVDAITRRLAGGFEDTHPVRPDAPEEDFLCLIPALSCFLLIVPFADADDIWRMARLDADADNRFRDRQMAFYRRCIQRHLYVHGTDSRFLSKNASFAGMIAGLDRAFPDARFICCMRPPERALSSQYSVLGGSLKAFASDGDPVAFQARIAACFEYYYANMLDRLEALPSNRITAIRTREIRDHLAQAVENIYATLGLDLTPAFRSRLENRARDSRGHASPHRHDLADAGIDSDHIRKQFAFVHRRFDFERDRFSGQPARDA